MVGVPRSMLGVVASSKGLVAGNLVYVDKDGVEVDCNLSQGTQSIYSVQIGNIYGYSFRNVHKIFF